jgi:outer membrane protein TolC
LGALLGALGVVHSASAEQLSIDDVAKLTVANLSELQAAREHATAASESSKGAGARLLPSVHVMDEYQYWKDPFKVPFNLPGLPPGPALQVRDANTNTFVASARQPLLGLLHGTENYKARSKQADATSANVEVNEADARIDVELEYLRLFQAKARSDIAKASAQELASEVTETEARVKAGTLTNSDLLRIQVAEASAQQQVIVADAEATVSRATILSAVGRSPDDTATEFLSPDALLAQADVPASEPAQAVARRPEMKAAKLRAEAAGHDERERAYALLPEVDLEGAFVRTDGNVFAPKNSGYVGIKADWAIWEWGAKNDAKKAAAAEARAAEYDIDATKRRVLREVTARKATLGSAASAVTLARQTIASAEEAYRVTEAQVRAGTNTTTDLLNAEAALTQARLQLENARYAQAAARILLERALGVR